MKENFQINNFDQLKSSVTATLELARPREYIGLGNEKIFTPFVIGEKFSKLHPHQTGMDQHKGNMVIIATNIVGSQAIAKCVLPSCHEMILLEAK
jgi:hypothetical protein